MEEPMKFDGFIESPEDKRDFTLSAVEEILQASAEEIPEVFMPDYSFLPTYHQHKQPSCIGHATTWMINYFEWVENNSKPILSPRFVYALCKKNDGMPNSDGTYFRMGLTEVKDYGLCEDTYYPNNTDLSRALYNDASLISSDAYDNAEPRKIKSYVKVDNLTFDGLKKAIYQNKVVLLGIRVDENMYTDRFGNVSWKEKDILPLRVPVNPGGHAIVVIGYDKDYIYFKNSWGETWGSNKQALGVGYFGKNYEKYLIEAWTAVDLPDEVIQQLKDAQKSLVQKLKEYIQYLKQQILQRNTQK